MPEARARKAIEEVRTQPASSRPTKAHRGPQRRNEATPHVIRPGDVLRVFQIIVGIARYKIGKLFVRIGLIKTPNPVRLRQMFERLGATFLKVGQILAMRPDFLPIEYLDELMKLLDNIRPFPTGQVRDIIKQELGSTPEDLFLSFDPVPLASATFGQVHRASLGQPAVDVVVKVQRPGMEKKIERDLRVLFFVAWIVDLTGLSATRLVSKVQEFARWTREELDYEWEAKHMTLFRNNMRGLDTARIPKVFWAYTTSRILTMEFVQGIWLSQILRAMNAGDEQALQRFKAAGYDGMVVARNLHENFLTSAFRYNLFHADQHAANLLIQEGNRVAYVDFGIVGKWDRRTQQIGLRFLRAINDEDVDKAFSVFRDEVAIPSKRTRMDLFEREFKAAMQDWLFHVGFKHATPEQKSLARLLLTILAAVSRNRLVLPLDSVAYFRTIITFVSI
jgi:predicted unusual protein kinase regulating ubiquinone biosynthesis (AarF/ABC1/UbiB family)